MKFLAIPLTLSMLATSATADDPPAFTRDVAPILVKNCLGCHNDKKAQGGLSMRTFADLRRGGDTNGAEILVPNRPDESGLIESISDGADPRMPYKLPPLAAKDRAVLVRWVAAGAKFDGASIKDTSIASLVDPTAGLVRIAVKAAVSDPVTCIVLSPDGKIAAAAIGRSIELYDLSNGKLSATFPDGPGPIARLVFSPDGSRLVAAGGRPGQFGVVQVWDIAKKLVVHDLRGHSDSILAADLAADGSTLATAGYDRLVKLWDLRTGREIRTLKEHTDAVFGVAFSPDGKLLASASADRTIKLWEMPSGARRGTLGDSTAEVYAVVFAPDGKSVIGAGVDRSIRSWTLTGDGGKLTRSAFAHDAPIIRLIATGDGTRLASSSEDRTVKLWDLATLQPLRAFEGQGDWPLSIALTPDKLRLVVGRYDGSIDSIDAATGKTIASLRGVAGLKPKSVPLVGNATLNPPSPRGVVRGSKVRATLTGNGVGDGREVIFPQGGLTAKIVPREKPDPSTLDIEIAVPTDCKIGVHAIAVRTPLGMTPPQLLAVSPDPEVSEREPNDLADQGTIAKLPATLAGAVDRPGDRDSFRVEGKAGRTLVFEVTAKTIGSPLNARLAILGSDGTQLAESRGEGGKSDAVLVFAPSADGPLTVRVEDADFGGSGAHVYRIRAGESPSVNGVFPSGVRSGGEVRLKLSGVNLAKAEGELTAKDAGPGTILPACPAAANECESADRLGVVVADGPQILESNRENGGIATAEPITVPGGVSGVIGGLGDEDVYRFEAKEGHRLIVETYGKRLGSPVDTCIVILDQRGQPVPRAVLRPVEVTNVAFRDHASASRSIRLTDWDRFAERDYVFAGRELMRIAELPRNPDDDSVMWGPGMARKDPGDRVAFLGTTPEHHPLGQPIYKVEIHPPGTVFPRAGLAPITLDYRNDDGGPGHGKDSQLIFDPPADGAYFIRVEETGGFGGATFGYHLVVREPKPNFTLSVNTENPNVPRGGTTLIQVQANRLDDFRGPIDINIDGLPPGVTAEPSTIEAESSTATILISASDTAEPFSPPTWSMHGSARPQESMDSKPIRHRLDPGGPRSGFITVRPEPPLKIRSASDSVTIRPGERIELTLRVERTGFTNRVPIDVRNLPMGVRVLNIGLNGVLVTEKETERSIFLYAEPWAEPTRRAFFAVGTCEATGTDHSSAPIFLTVSPAPKSGPPRERAEAATR